MSFLVATASSAFFFWLSPTPPALISALWAYFFSLTCLRISSSGPKGTGSASAFAGGAAAGGGAEAAVFPPDLPEAVLPSAGAEELEEFEAFDPLDALVVFFSTTTSFVFSFWGAYCGASSVFLQFVILHQSQTKKSSTKKYSATVLTSVLAETSVITPELVYAKEVYNLSNWLCLIDWYWLELDLMLTASVVDMTPNRTIIAHS